MRFSLFTATIAVSASCLCASGSQVSMPQGSPRISFTPIGGYGATSAAYSYYTGGTPVVRLPNGLTIDPGNTGVGITLYDPNQQQAAQQRYQVQTAQAAQAYQAEMEMKRNAMQAANTQPKPKSAMRQGYDPKTGSQRKHSGSSKGAAEVPALSASGAAWPDFAPKNAKRETADAAIREVQAEAKANGFASVASTVEAKNALRAYGMPALKGVPGGSKVLAQRLREQLVRIDGELDRLSDSGAKPAP